jgi:amino acid adenylation domain-containing protein
MTTRKIRLDRRRSELSPEQRVLLQQRLRGQRIDVAAQPVISRRDPHVLPPLSFAQERLWFLDQLNPGDTTYNCIDMLPLDFAVDADVLERSVNEIVRRHESLRTTFRAEDGVPVQIVAPTPHIALPVIDLRYLPGSRRDAEVRRLGTEEAERPFNLAQGPLLRTTLLRTGDPQYILLLAMHHIVADGWAMGIFWKDLAAVWEAFELGRPSPLPELPIQYADFATWQRKTVAGEELERHLAYWRQQLRGLPVLNLPTDHPRPAMQTFGGARRPVFLTPSITASLNDLSRREGVTLFMTLLAVFAVLLYRYTDQEDFAVGTYLAGRNRLELENLVGFFINTVVMRCDLSGDPSFSRVLARTKEMAIDAYSHQEAPFALLVRELRPVRDPSRNPLFQVLFHLFNAPNWDPRDFSADPAAHDLTPESALFDLVLTLVETPDGLVGAFDYNVDLFEAGTVERMAGHFATLVEGLIANPDGPIAAVPMMSSVERRLILKDWNDTARAYTHHQSIVGLFESQTDRSPDAVAFAYNDQELCFRELDCAANRVAAHLRTLGIARGAFVGVMLPRSFEAVVSLIAILKVGAVYVPLDLSYPRERLRFMVSEAGVSAILTTRVHEEACAGLSWKLVCIDDPEITSARDSSLDELSLPDEPAYLIFTSGSTGRPKGVVVPHRQVLNRLAWMHEKYPFRADEVGCHKTKLSFVDSLWELLGPLLQGCRSVIVPDATLRDPTGLVETLAKHRVTRIWLVPSLLRAILETVPQLGERVPTLKFWVSSGEALSVELYRRFRSLLPDRVLYNLYGTSEVWDATWYDPEANPIDEAHARSVPVGRPIGNVQTYVLDSRLQPVPIGVQGELFVAGVGLAHGYINQPELTAARFVANPFTDEPGARMYRTGDIARYLCDGNLEYVSRLDQQVKLRGFRIELGEVEAVLSQHQDVRQVKVVVREDRQGEPRLVAYIVPSRAVSEAPVGLDASGKGAPDPTAGWQEVWDETYRERRVEVEETFNISGFNSTYSGLPIPAEEVREWVTQAVARVLTFRPRTVFEIGCGTGLLLFQIAPHCEQYLATDFSSVAIGLVKAQLANHHLPHVQVTQRAADDLSDARDDSVDAVVINSVVQYFPTVEYLVRVLENATRIVRPGGFIFVGDVRSLPLLEAFHASVELYRSGDDLSITALKQRVRDRLLAEEELVIDPAFFIALRTHLVALGDVEIWPKQGRYHNEFTCFRYDVMLRKGPPTAVGCDMLRLDWFGDHLSQPGLLQLLHERQPSLVVVSHVPNQRVTAHLAALEALDRLDPSITVAGLRHYLHHNLDSNGIDPEAFWSVSQKVPYAVDVYWAGNEAKDHYDVWLRRRLDSATANTRSTRPVPEPEMAPLEPWKHYVNNPNHGNFVRKLVPELFGFARGRLPDYMIPSAVVVLDDLPLNSNGKLDQHSLPAPNLRRGSPVGPFVSFRSDTERVLSEMFAEVLGTDLVGVNDDFFADLQGHSLLATRLISRIREAFRIELPLRAIFEAPTVAGLARAIEETDGADRIGGPTGIKPLVRGPYVQGNSQPSII